MTNTPITVEQMIEWLSKRHIDDMDQGDMEMYEAIRDHLKASPWQPIETAPKDGSCYLAINEHGGVCVCHWDEMEWSDLIPCVFPLSDAILWMPLPNSPKGDA